MSDADGSSLAAAFCAASMMLLPCSMAASSALMDFGRPTNSGITICGKTTTSRNGNKGSVVCSVNLEVVMAYLIESVFQILAHRAKTQDRQQKFFLQVFRLIHQLESKHRSYSKRLLNIKIKKPP